MATSRADGCGGVSHHREIPAVGAICPNASDTEGGRLSAGEYRRRADTLLTKEYIQFLFIARGSLMELLSYFAIAHELKYVQQADLERIESECEDIGKMLNGLISSLRAKRPNPNPKPPVPKPKSQVPSP